MIVMLRGLSCAVALSCLAWGSACAQTGEAASIAPSPAMRQSLRIPINTPIVFEFVTTLDSKKSNIDETFPIRLLRPILIDGGVAVAEGTMGAGQVVHAAKAGFGGRAGELIVAVRYLDHRGVRIRRGGGLAELDAALDRARARRRLRARVRIRPRE